MSDEKISALPAASLPLGADALAGVQSGTTSKFTLTNLLNFFQAADSDLTAIAALSTTTFGRSLLILADAGSLRTLAGLGTAATQNTSAFDSAGAAAAAQSASQPLDSDLTAIAALTTTAFGRGLLALADAAALRTSAGLGTAATQNTSAFDTSGAAAAAQAASQPVDSDLTTIAGLTATTNNFIQSKASAWSSRTPTQVTADLIAMVGDSGSGGTKGLVPAPGAGDAAALRFLKADGTWSTPSGSGLSTTLTATHLYIGNASNVATDTALSGDGTLSNTGALTLTNGSTTRSHLGLAIGTDVQAHDSDLDTIAGLTATTNNFVQSKASAWSSRTPTQVTADLDAMVGDFGSGGTKGLVPAPGAGDAAALRFLKADGTWATPSGSGLSTTLTSAHLYIGNGSNVATDVALSGDGTLANTGALTLTNGSTTRTHLGLAIGTDVQAHDADLDTIAGLTATTNNFIQSKSSAWSSRTPTQVTADLIAMVGDSGSGGTKGLVPAPASGDAAAGRFLKANGLWAVPAGGSGFAPSYWINASANGVVGDGITDDSGAIQTLINSAPNVGSGSKLRIMFDEARYKIGTGLTIAPSKNVELVGVRGVLSPNSGSSSNPAGTVFLATSNNQVLITVGDGVTQYEPGPYIANILGHANGHSGVVVLAVDSCNYGLFEYISGFEVKTIIQGRKTNGLDNAWHTFRGGVGYRIGFREATGGGRGIDLGGFDAAWFYDIALLLEDPGAGSYTSGTTFGFYGDGDPDDVVDATRTSSCYIFGCDIDGKGASSHQTAIYMRRALFNEFNGTKIEACAIGVDFDGGFNSNSNGRGNRFIGGQIDTATIGIQFETGAGECLVDMVAMEVGVATPINDLSLGGNTIGRIIGSTNSGSTPMNVDAPNVVSGTSYTLAYIDRGGLTSFTSSSAVAVTVPQNSTTAFPVGSRFQLKQTGTGKITISGSGITFQSPNGLLSTNGQHGVIELIKTAVNTWAVTGDIDIPALPTVRTVSGTTGTFADGDMNNIVDCTNASGCTMTIPNSLTINGVITVRKGNTGDVTIVAGSGVTLDEPGSRTKVITQYQTMAALPFGSLTHFVLSGAEA